MDYICDKDVSLYHGQKLFRWRPWRRDPILAPVAPCTFAASSESLRGECIIRLYSSSLPSLLPSSFSSLIINHYLIAWKSLKLSIVLLLILGHWCCRWSEFTLYQEITTIIIFTITIFIVIISLRGIFLNEFTLYKEILLSCTSGQTNPSPEKDHKLNTICKLIIITSFFLFTQIFYTRNDFWIWGVTTPSLFWTKEESYLRTSYLCLNFYCSSSSPIRKPVWEWLKRRGDATSWLVAPQICQT